MYKVDIKSRRPDAEPSNVKIATYQFTSNAEAVEFAKNYNAYSQIKIAVVESQNKVDNPRTVTAE